MFESIIKSLEVVDTMKSALILVKQDRINQVQSDIAYANTSSGNVVFLPDGTTKDKQTWINEQNAEIVSNVVG